ncbi:TVP38/TMEM64 family protein [Halalkalibacterium ligniniphilum]|uniref:TVP38/TMEM64 family protein n=1 Tax=Halalkalibacterium ligniniphilum TaxID=1134413 RepID=UPI00034DDE41|nr:TVP38/TMEM64 family protein [Halalkalibacterium ligniniphilum]
METSLESLLILIEESGWLAPVLFVLLHVFRQVLFIPVIVICLLGGYLFGTFYGSLYSLIGLTLVSVVFFLGAHQFPSFLTKLSSLKDKWLKGKGEMTLAQMMLLRSVPFVHFHFVSLYLIESEKTLKDYTKTSLLVCIPPAIIYTSFGDIIHELPLIGTIVFALFMTILFLIFRKKEQRYKLDDFLRTKAP